MIFQHKKKDKSEIKVEAHFAYPLNNMPKSLRYMLASACVTRLEEDRVESLDVVLDKVRIEKEQYAFSSRPRSAHSILIEIGPGSGIPPMRLMRRDGRYVIQRLSRTSLEAIV